MYVCVYVCVYVRVHVVYVRARSVHVVYVRARSVHACVRVCVWGGGVCAYVRACMFVCASVYVCNMRARVHVMFSFFVDGVHLNSSRLRYQPNPTRGLNGVLLSVWKWSLTTCSAD